jgi:hypothetical protein
MDRAIASGAIGREFESLRAHQILPILRLKCGSGFRLRAPASLTPAKRLKFESLRAHQTSFRKTRTTSSHILISFDCLSKAGLARGRGIVGDSDREVDGDSGFGLDRLSVLEIGLEAPLADGLLRRCG